MLDWDKLRMFHAVAQAKSLTRASETLNLSQSAVSRQISTLEESMGLALFHRHARGLILTEQGEILFRTASEIAAKLQQAEVSLTEAAARPKGPFKITVPATFGALWLSAQMREYTDLYPEIDVTLICEDRELDLTTREADAAIRFHPAKHPDLVQVPIMRLRNGLFASNDYLREYGIPTTIRDLADHKLLAFDTSTGKPPFPEVNWLFEQKGANTLKPSFKTNSLIALRTAVKQGMGIAALPEYLVHRTRRISRVLPELDGPATEAWYVYPMELKNSKRIAVFRSFISQKIAESSF